MVDIIPYSHINSKLFIFFLSKISKPSIKKVNAIMKRDNYFLIEIDIFLESCAKSDIEARKNIVIADNRIIKTYIPGTIYVTLRRRPTIT